MYAWRHRRVPSAWRLFHLMWVLCVWAVFFALNLCATTVPVKVFFWNLGAVCAQLVALFVFSFAIEVTGNSGWLTPSRIALLSIIPVAAGLAAFSGGSHQLFGHGFAVVRRDNLAFLVWEKGALFLVHYVYIMAVFAISTTLYATALARAAGRERVRYVLMLAVTVVPVCMELFSITPVRGLSMLHSTFWLLGAGYALAIFKYGLIDLVPVARERLFEEMVDPVLIVDAEGRLAAANRSARPSRRPARCFGAQARGREAPAGT